MLLIKVQIVNGIELRPKDFVALVEVMQVSSTKIATGSMSTGSHATIVKNKVTASKVKNYQLQE